MIKACCIGDASFTVRSPAGTSLSATHGVIVAKRVMKTAVLLYMCCLAAACCGNTGPVEAPAAQTQSEVSVASSDPSADLGPELATDPGLEGAYTVGLNHNWYYEGTIQPAQSTSPHSGTSAQQVQLSIANNAPSNANANMWTSATVTVGEWYRASFWAKRVLGTAGDVYPWIYAPGGGVSYLSQPITSGTYTRYVCTAQATATSLEWGVNNAPSSAPSDIVVIDDLSLRAIPFASMVSLHDDRSQYGKAMAHLTLLSGTQAGVVFCADTATNPQNYLLAYHDGRQIGFYKVIGGVYMPLPTGADIPYYRVSTNPDVAYVPGAALLISRTPGTDVFSVYYNGHYVWQQSVTDAAVINNTLHGVFNTFEGNRVQYAYSPAMISKNVVFLGGSITNGAGATEQKYSWQWLLRDYLDVNYPDISWKYANATAGGTDSWYSLIRLKSDVLAYNPDIVFVDEAVNDGELAPSNPAWPYVGEAIIRRIRIAFPNAKIVIANFMRPVGSNVLPDANSETLRAAWNQIASYYQCDLYRLDTALSGVLPVNPTSAQIDAYFSGPGDVHPNNAGHRLIFSGLSSAIDPLTVNAWTGNLADYSRLGPYTQYYEAAPVIFHGAELLAGQLTTGTWNQTGDGAIASALPGSTLTYTGPMVMAGLDVALQNGSWPSGLQYSLDGGAWTNVVPQNGAVWNSEFTFISGPRAVHTLSIKLNSGSATINRLLIL